MVITQVDDSRKTCSSSEFIKARSGFVDVEMEELTSFNCKAESISAENTDWIMDTGATQHMTGNKSYFQDLNTTVHGSVHMADKTSQPIQGVGSIKLYLKDLPAFKLKDVLYVPALKQNLLSLSTLVDRGYNLSITAKDKELEVTSPSGEVMMKGKMEGKLIKLAGKSATEASFADVDLALSSTTLLPRMTKDAVWHARLGHISLDRLKNLENVVIGLPHFSAPSMKCEACIMAKSCRQPFKPSTWKSTRCLELVHSDICGPMPLPTLKGKSYIITFIDDYSKRLWVSFLEKKSDAFEAFKNFKSLAERESGYLIKTFRSDNGEEYRSNDFETFLSSFGIKHQLIMAGTPQQNGVSERMNRTLLNMARALLIYKNIPFFCGLKP